MSYSYSKISTYNQCPFRYKLKYIDKVETPFEDSAVFEKGRFIHSLFEFYPEIPEFSFKFSEVESKKEDYISFVNYNIKSNKILKFLFNESVILHREKQFYLDYNFKEILTKENSFLNGIIDYVGKYKDTILLVDWKTGKTQNHASLDQLKFYSLWVFENFDVEKIQCSLNFIEQDFTKSELLTRNDYSKIKSYYLDKINTIEHDTSFFKKRSESNCKYCPYINECQRINLRRTK